MDIGSTTAGTAQLGSGCVLKQCGHKCVSWPSKNVHSWGLVKQLPTILLIGNWEKQIHQRRAKYLIFWLRISKKLQNGLVPIKTIIGTTSFPAWIEACLIFTYKDHCCNGNFFATPGAWVADSAMIKSFNSPLCIFYLAWHCYLPEQWLQTPTIQILYNAADYCQPETRPLVKHSSLGK